MSQYVPGVIDYVPEIQPYKPDLNFFQQVLQTKQAQYDAGYNKLSSIYGSLLNSPMLKNENIDVRNKFFNDIAANITKISAMDLSIEQNVNAAQKVFQPLIDNDYIMKDMAFTKKYQQALDRHEYFKNCVDEKKCGGRYWTDGLKYINYQAEDFVKASLDESLTFSNPEYIPFTNAVQKAVQLAKDMDFSVDAITKSGGYNIITTNGAVMVPDLTDFFISNFANDGNVRQVYDVLAFNKRKDYAKANASYFNGSEDQAEMHYLDNMARFVESTTEKEQQRALDKLDLAKSRQKLGEQIIKQVGVDPDDPSDQTIINNVQQSITDQLIAQTTADVYDLTNQMVSSSSFNDSDIIAKRNRIDSAMSNSLFAADMMKAASNYANLTYKIKSYEADPFALKKMEFENAKALKYLQYDLDYELAKKKGEIVEPSEEPPMSDPATPGSSFENADLYATEESTKRQFSQNTAQAVQDVAFKVDADFQAVLSIPNGQEVANGVLMSDDLRKEIIRTREAIFNQGDTRTESQEMRENSIGDYLWTDLKGAVLGAWDWLTGGDDPAARKRAYVEQELKEEEDVVGYKDVQVTDKGFLNANGSLGPLTSNPSFMNPNSINHYDKVLERITTLYSDPNSLVRKALGPVSNDVIESITGKGGAFQQQQLAKIENDRIASNVALITRSFENMDLDLSDYVDPVLAKDALSKITYGDDSKRYFISKEDFVSDYLKNFKQKGQELEAERQRQLKLREGMSFFERLSQGYNRGLEGYIGAPSPLYQTPDYQVQNEAAELYDEYMNKFRSEYNRADDATKPYEGFKTWSPVGGGGAGGQANPYTIAGVDPRFPNTPGASSFKWTHTDLLRAISDPQYSDLIAVFEGDPGKFTINDINEAYEKGIGQSQLAVLQIIRDDIRQGKKGDDASRFDFQVFPVVGNNPETVGFKVRLNPRFIEGHKGGKETPGYTADMSEIAIIMPREAISKDNPALAGLDRTPIDKIMDAYEEVNITAWSEYGGKSKITKSPSGGFKYEIFTKVFDPATGQFKEVLSSSGINTQLTAGQIADQINPMLSEIYENNLGLQQQYKKNNKQNRITDPSQLGLNP